MIYGKSVSKKAQPDQGALYSGFMSANRRKSGRVREKSRVGAMPAVGYIPQNLREGGGVDSYSILLRCHGRGI